MMGVRSRAGGEMSKAGRNLVYYSIYLSREGDRRYQAIVTQHLRSIESLRRYNSAIPVVLGVWERRLKKKESAHSPTSNSSTILA